MNEEYTPVGNLSESLKNLLEEERLKNEAWAMVDALSEEDPTIDQQKAYEVALNTLKNPPENTAEEKKEDVN